MTVHELSRTDARRIAVRAQLLDSTRPDGLLDLVPQLRLLQIDPVAAIAPSADLVAWSRLGPSYAPAELDAALAGRSLIELRAMIRPARCGRVIFLTPVRCRGSRPAGPTTATSA